MRTIRAIAYNNYLETIRDKILYVFIAFAVLLIGASLILGSISLDQDVKIVMDFGMAGIFFFGVLIAIFVGANSIYKEKEKRTIYTILPKPIETWQFVIGKFLGLCLTLLATTGMMAIVLVAVILIKTHSFSPLVLEAIFFEYLELALLVSIVLVFSAFASPISAAIYTICLFVIGHSTTIIYQLAQKTGSVVLSKLLLFFYYVFPNLEKFNLRTNASFGIGIGGEAAVLIILYALVYISLMLILATLIFRKQEF